MKADALSAARILSSFQALDATGDAAWRTGLKNTFGLSLAGQILTFPVTPDANALSNGFTRISVPGAELLGVRLEVTVTTPDINSPYGLGANGKPLDLGPALMPGGTAEGGLPGGEAPVADLTGAAARTARLNLALPNVSRPGATLEIGLPLNVRPGLIQAAPAIDPATPVAPLNGPAQTVDGTKIAGATGDPAQFLGNLGLNVVDTGTSMFASRSSQLASNNAAGLVTNNGAGLVTNNGAGLVSSNAAGLVTNNGGNIVTNNGGSLSGFPYLPVAPVLAKYDLLTFGPPAPAYRRITPTGLVEYLWGEGSLAVRAIDVEGNALTGWGATNSAGEFKLNIPDDVPKVFFIECEGAGGLAHVYSLAFAPGGKDGVVAIDSSTTLIAIGTVHLFNFIPPEDQRMTGLLAAVKNQASADKAALQGLSQKTPLFKNLATQVATLNKDSALIQARINELTTSFAAFAPTNFSQDMTATYQVLDSATAIADCQSADTESVYNALFAKSQARQLSPKSLLPITLVSQF